MVWALLSLSSTLFICMFWDKTRGITNNLSESRCSGKNMKGLALKNKFTYPFSFSTALAFAAESILEHPSSWRIEEIMRFLWTICNDQQVYIISQVCLFSTLSLSKVYSELCLPGPLELFATFARLVLKQAIKSERKANGDSQLRTNIDICRRGNGNDWMGLVSSQLFLSMYL